MEADVPTSQGMWTSLEAGRDQNTALKILWFLTSGLLSGKEYISVVSSHQVCSNLLQQPLKTSTMSKLIVIIVQSLSHMSLGPHGLWHTRFLCPLPSPRVRSNSCPLSWWCYLTISSSFAPFSFCLQSFPASVFSNELTLCIRWPKCWSLFQQQSFQWKFRVDFL